MLTPLNKTETAHFANQLIANFPRQLLYLIGSAGGQRERQFRTWMLRWLPDTFSSEQIQEWVSRSLDWFINDGHIQRQPGGGYSCLPPYIVGGSEHLDGKVYLYGHPHGTNILLQQHCQQRAQPIYDASFPLGPLGYEREFSMTLQQKRAVGMKCIEPTQLADALPRIANLPEPDVALAEVLPDGMCQCYVPRFANQAFEHRWVHFSEAVAQKYRLIRWLPSDKPDDRFATRYFYWSYQRYAVALRYDEAVMWRLAIDAETYPQHVWWNAQREELFLPMGLPASYWQWLFLATLQRPVRDGRHYRISIPAAAVPTVKNLLISNLSLEWVQGRPTS